MPPNTASVSRPGRWGNPYRVTAERGPVEAVRLYCEWLLYTPAGRLTLETARVELRGKDLACWCPLDYPCHADVLLHEANRD